MVGKGLFFPGQNEKGSDNFQAFAHVGYLVGGAEPAHLFGFSSEVGGDAAEACGDFP